VLRKLKTRITAAPVNTSRHYLREFAREAAAVGSDTSFRVLDAGAGDLPYADLFAHVSYESADHTHNGKVDYVCDLAALPMADETYDLVFCSQALEHVPDPIAVLRELHRVLRPGGQAWLTAPLFYQEHGKPHDYYRYTRFGWRHMATEAGFTVDKIEWLEGYYGTLSYQLHMASKNLPADLRIWRPFLLHLARTLARRDLKKRVTGKGMCKNYQVRLAKPEG
jgi:SAM-dependent methyltransferase